MTKKHKCSSRTNGYGGFTCMVCHETCDHNDMTIDEAREIVIENILHSLKDLNKRVDNLIKRMG